MNFEYDTNKSKLNKQKHGIDFEKSKGIWFEDNVIAPAVTKDEPRFMIIGKIEGSLYSCIYTMRSRKIRLFACRKSRANEKKVYYGKIS